jgi:hypothetical protein
MTICYSENWQNKEKEHAFNLPSLQNLPQGDLKDFQVKNCN